MQRVRRPTFLELSLHDAAKHRDAGVARLTGPLTVCVKDRELPQHAGHAEPAHADALLEFLDAALREPDLVQEVQLCTALHADGPRAARVLGDARVRVTGGRLSVSPLLARTLGTLPARIAPEATVVAPVSRDVAPFLRAVRVWHVQLTNARHPAADADDADAIGAALNSNRTFTALSLVLHARSRSTRPLLLSLGSHGTYERFALSQLELQLADAGPPCTECNVSQAAAQAALALRGAFAIDGELRVSVPSGRLSAASADALQLAAWDLLASGASHVDAFRFGVRRAAAHPKTLLDLPSRVREATIELTGRAAEAALANASLPCVRAMRLVLDRAETGAGGGLRAATLHMLRRAPELRTLILEIKGDGGAFEEVTAALGEHLQQCTRLTGVHVTFDASGPGCKRELRMRELRAAHPDVQWRSSENAA